MCTDNYVFYPTGFVSLICRSASLYVNININAQPAICYHYKFKSNIHIPTPCVLAFNPRYICLIVNNCRPNL